MIKFFKGVLLTFSAEIASLFLVMIINVIITRWLGPGGKGALALITNYFLILTSVFSFGMSESVVFFLSSRKYKSDQIFSSIIFNTVVISLIIILLSLLLRGFVIEKLLGKISNLNYYTALWLFPAFYLFLFVRKVLLGYKNLKAFNAMLILRALGYLLFYLILIPKLQLRGGIIGMVLSVMIVDIVGIIIISKYGRPGFTLNLTLIKDSIVFGMKSQIGILLSFFDRRLDIFIINIFLNPDYVGLYAIAVALAELPWHISGALGTVLFPEVAGMKKPSALKFVTVLCRNSLFITTLLCIILFLSGPILIKLLFGSKFLPSVPALRVLLPGIIALAFNRVLCGGFSGLGKPEYGTYTVICSAIVTVCLDILLVPKMGIIGASLASSIAYISAATIGVVIFKKISGCKISELFLTTKSDLSRYPSLITKILQKGKNE